MPRPMPELSNSGLAAKSTPAMLLTDRLDRPGPFLLHPCTWPGWNGLGAVDVWMLNIGR